MVMAVVHGKIAAKRRIVVGCLVVLFVRASLKIQGEGSEVGG